MEQSGGIILSTMARDGWDVKAKDPDAGLYELSLPSVDYSLPGGSVSIPSPRFETTVRDLFRRVDDGLTERLLGDLVLVNGEDLITVKLGFPFSTTLSLSAAGYTRCLVGWEADRISVSTYIEVGLRLPSVPGLEQLMRFFVRTYRLLLLLLLLLLLDFSWIFRRCSSTFDLRWFSLDFGLRGPFSGPRTIRNEPRMKN